MVTYYLFSEWKTNSIVLHPFVSSNNMSVTLGIYKILTCFPSKDAEEKHLKKHIEKHVKM